MTNKNITVKQEVNVQITHSMGAWSQFEKVFSFILNASTSHGQCKHYFIILYISEQTNAKLTKQMYIIHNDFSDSVDVI